ncbi:MAG: GAF domain-containing protein [Spirochaetaceae bacterium]|nr:GAF domain-containing protein [Spirochaetaceae bacterium]
MDNPQKAQDPKANLKLMVEVVKTLFEDETDLIAVLANISAVIKMYLDDINWAGFYLRKGPDLVLGPFQGLPACSRIGEGKGVCGTAASTGRPVIVADVHAFPGHIACDSNSNAEIVIPFFKDGRVFGVLDVDSPRLNRFSDLEAEYLTQIGGLIGDFLNR